MKLSCRLIAGGVPASPRRSRPPELMGSTRARSKAKGRATRIWLGSLRCGNPVEEAPRARGGGGGPRPAVLRARAVLLKAVKGRGNSGASEEGFFSSPAFRLSRIAFIVH